MPGSICSDDRGLADLHQEARDQIVVLVVRRRVAAEGVVVTRGVAAVAGLLAVAAGGPLRLALAVTPAIVAIGTIAGLLGLIVGRRVDDGLFLTARGVDAGEVSGLIRAQESDEDNRRDDSDPDRLEGNGAIPAAHLNSPHGTVHVHDQ